MYTEIKELVNFLAIYMYHRIPRRRISLCMESFANHLATRFHDNWRLDEPKYAEDERIVAIKTLDGLDGMFCAVAASLGVDMDELYASFPSSIVVYCNPGEVTCRISEYPPVVTIWRGKVDEDRFYVPTPIGAAKYYDGNSHNIRNTVLSAYMVKEPLARPVGCARTRDVKPERCIPLNLVSSADISAYDLLATGFIDLNQVPPILFRYSGPDSKHFTVRSFASTRFGSHRPRPDHKVMRRIQHAAAYLAITNGDTMNQAAAAPLFANAPVTSHHYTVTLPFTPPTFPNTISTYNPTLSIADFTNPSSMIYVKSGHSNPTFPAAPNSPPSMFPNSNLTPSNQFATTFSPDSANYFIPWDNVTPKDGIQSYVQSIGFPIYNEFGQPQSNWSYTTPINNHVFGTEYDIWKPIPTFTMNNGNSTESVFVNNYIFDSPMFSSPMGGLHANESNAPQSFQDPSDSDMNDLQYHLSNFSFLDMSPQRSPAQVSPQVLPQQASPQVSPQQVFPTQVSLTPMQLPQMLPPQLPSQQILSQQVSPRAVPMQSMQMQSVPMQSMPMQSMPMQSMPMQSMPMQSMPMQSMPIQSVPIQSVPIQSVPIQSVPIQSVPIQSVPMHSVPMQSVPMQSMPMQSMPTQTLPMQAFLPQMQHVESVQSQVPSQQMLSQHMMSSQMPLSNEFPPQVLQSQQIPHPPKESSLPKKRSPLKIRPPNCKTE